jgi:hypothetical protein
MRELMERLFQRLHQRLDQTERRVVERLARIEALLKGEAE